MTTLPGVAPTKALLKTLQTGSADRIVSELFHDFEPSQLPAPLRDRTQQLAQLLVDLRRQEVATLGNHEAFVRHTPDGSLMQVIRPVRLSLADKTLYQIPTTRIYWKNADGSRGDRVQGRVSDWSRVIKVTEPLEPGRASLQFAGYVKLNAVAGCAVTNPRTVWVDGQERVNPYIERAKTSSGRLGDIVRIVVSVTVAGPAPATGNPVVLTYTLDYDPSKDLQAMLAHVASRAPDDVYLVDELEWEDTKKPGWKFLPLYGGVGWAHNLRNNDVRDVYKDFTNILANAPKKALTVAQRNAMRTHPALGVQTVEIDAEGRAVIPVIGWAGDNRAMQRWQRLLDALSRGEGIDSVDFGDVEVEVETVSHTYEPETTEPVEVESDTLRRDVIEHDETEAVDELEQERERRARLVAKIDEGLELCSPSFVSELDYEPEMMDLGALADILKAVNDHLDEAAAAEE